MKIFRNQNKAGVRVITFATLLATIAAGASAKPARRGPISVEQPDGTQLTIRLEGDEFRHAAFTDDGYPLLYDDALGYVYADIMTDGTLSPTRIKAADASMRQAAERSFLAGISPERIAASRKAMTAADNTRGNRASAPSKGPGLCSTTYPLTGEQKGLVILVEYTDVKFGTSNTKFNYADYSDGGAHQYFSDMLNKPGFDGCGAVGSCRDWFLQNSRNAKGESQFIPTFDVYGPVTLPNNMRYYGGNDSRGNDRNPQKMVIHACELLDDEIDFSQYDRDGDGYVDNIYIFYAGLGEADGGSANTVWPHSWDISAAESATYRFDGKIIDHYACSNETDATTRRPDGVGTFVHEFSHVMGLPDLYTTSYNSSYTPGAYSVLDYGPYTNEGRTPPNYSAYERYALGWLEPEEYGEEGIYSLGHIADTNEAYIVKTEKANEYFLVENRQQKGWDTYLPGHGMLIWHVDYVRSVFNNNTVNNTPSHQYVDLIEANNRQADAYAAGHPFPGTSGVDSYTFKSWSRRDTGVSFSGITEDTETGLISKTAVNTNYTGPSAISNMAEEDTSDTEYYNLQGIRVTDPAKGQLLIRKQGLSTSKIIF